MQGGASGAIIVDGIENVQPAVAGLPERVLLIRDETTIPGGPAPGGNVPSWDVSLNYVPISYPAFTPAVIRMKPGQREFWRVANASADTIIDLQLRYDSEAQPFQVVALDGVPTGSQDGRMQGQLITQTHILLAPAARAEFIVTGPSSKVKNAAFMTLNIDTGPFGDNDPTRPARQHRDDGAVTSAAGDRFALDYRQITSSSRALPKATVDGKANTLFLGGALGSEQSGEPDQLFHYSGRSHPNAVRSEQPSGDHYQARCRGGLDNPEPVRRRIMSFTCTRFTFCFWSRTACRCPRGKVNTWT